MNFEDDLRAALRREPAPDNFAANVLAKAGQRGKVAALPLWRRPATWALAAGLSVAALIPPAVLEYRHRQEQRALEAKHELLFALRITRTKLQQTRERVRRATARHTL